MLNRRRLLLSAAAPVLWPGRASAASPGATVLYADRTTPVEKIRPDAKDFGCAQPICPESTDSR